MADIPAPNVAGNPPQPVNALQTYGSLLGLQQQQMQNRLLQGTLQGNQAANNALQGAMGPDGSVDPNAYAHSLMGAASASNGGFNAAPLLAQQAATQQAAAQAKLQEIQTHMAGLQNMYQRMQAVYADPRQESIIRQIKDASTRGDISATDSASLLTDYANAVAPANGDKAREAELTKQWLIPHFANNLSAQQFLGEALGQFTPVNTGNQIEYRQGSALAPALGGPQVGTQAGPGIALTTPPQLVGPGVHGVYQGGGSSVTPLEETPAQPSGTAPTAATAGAAPAQSTPTPAAKSLWGANQTTFQANSAPAIQEYDKSLNAKVQANQNMMQSLDEMKKLAEKVTQGGWQNTRMDVAKWVQGASNVMGLDAATKKALVDGIAGGDLGAEQAFEKLATINALSSLHALGGSNADASFQTMRHNLPGITTDPRGFQVMLNYMEKIRDRDLAEQTAWTKYRNTPGADLTQFQNKWQNYLGQGIDPKGIKTILQDPKLADKFDKRYSYPPGTGAHILRDFGVQ